MGRLAVIGQQLDDLFPRSSLAPSFVEVSDQFKQFGSEQGDPDR